MRRWTGLGALLALLALSLGVLTPQGFMPGAGPSGPTLVICTGHGPMIPAGGQDRSDPGSSHQGGGHVCPFAGHGLTASPPMLSLVATTTVSRWLPPTQAMTDLAPGRGLAAPPPPSQGPPPLA